MRTPKGQYEEICLPILIFMRLTNASTQKGHSWFEIIQNNKILNRLFQLLVLHTVHTCVLRN